MPTFEQAEFIGRAIQSLLTQQHRDWECVIVDDGSRDHTFEAVAPYLGDARIHYQRLASNHGLGAALNMALGKASGRLIAYLPSDDVIYAEHLASLAACLERNRGAGFAFSGVRHHYNRFTEGPIPGFPPQLVQVMHLAGPERWVERTEFETDDLERMFWCKLRVRGEPVGTGLVSCEWVDHPGQRHKLIREPGGGINPYRQRYRVTQPLRFHTSTGNRIDEVEQYRRFRERPAMRPAAGGLKIVLVGELAYNAERILALEERGHQLYGLWMRRPYWYNTVGPLPFGRVEDIPAANWREELRRIKPDVIYALLNWQAVPWAHEVLRGNPGIPFVWHFKEGPFICLEKGTWEQLVELYTRADGRIYSTAEMRDWFAMVAPECAGDSLVLDGDLPKREWFSGNRAPLLSDADGEAHTVAPGRPIGLHPRDVAVLAAHGVHLHFYGDFTQGQWRQWIAKTIGLAPRHLHLHAHVDPAGWVSEFSRYDAGWLHFFKSENRGDLRAANWDDLNCPARMATLAAAGLPVLQRDNSGSIVATQTLARRLDAGLFFEDMEQLADSIRERGRLARLRENMWRRREEFTFDRHAGALTDFFRATIAGSAKSLP